MAYQYYPNNHYNHHQHQHQHQIYGQLITDYHTILHHHIHIHIYCEEDEETFFYDYPSNFAVNHDPAFTQETNFFHNFPAYDGDVAVLDGLLVYDEDSVAPPPQPDDGLPEEVVARFLMNATCEEAAGGGEPELCTVCQDDLCRKDQKVVALNCWHRFHGNCVGKWLQMKNRCPLCKAIAIDIS